MLKKLQEYWQKIKEYVRNEYDITRISYDTWIVPLQLYEVDGDIVRVYYHTEDDHTNDTSFLVRYISKKYSLPLSVAIEELTGFHCTVEMIEEPTRNKSLFYKEEKEEETSFSNVRGTNLNPEYTFDTFVIGPNNDFAHAASLSVAESPGSDYNPLFLYGGSGLGKTHLMHAIANFISKNNPSAKIMYVTSETFTNDIINAMRVNQMKEIKDKYRNVDILLIDDIQFIIGKERSQEEFFNTFNELYDKKKQIVISSDKPPKNFTTLDERLKSRLQWNLPIEITKPDYETRMAILRKKQDKERFRVGEEILNYIASNIKTNIRDLEGALTKISYYKKLHPDTELTLDLARQNLNYIINPEEESILTPEHIIKTVAEHYGIRPEDIVSSKRNREIVLPRQVTMYLIRCCTDISQTEVGKVLGNRDHSTIIHGFNKITEELRVNKELAETIDIIKKKLSQ